MHGTNQRLVTNLLERHFLRIDQRLDFGVGGIFIVRLHRDPALVLDDVGDFDFKTGHHASSSCIVSTSTLCETRCQLGITLSFTFQTMTPSVPRSRMFSAISRALLRSGASKATVASKMR